ncbi:MAG: hypothetical protein HY046_00525 [Acidobacteria bacterium]|nr:hypothetical protein [Acidobacteriota bacterium]
MRVQTAISEPSLFVSPPQLAKDPNAFQFARRKYNSLLITGFTTFDIQFTDVSHAYVRAEVQWKTNGKEVRRESVIHFEKVDGTWYFTNLDFLREPQTNPFIPIVLAILGGCAIGLFVRRWRSRSD